MAKLVVLKLSGNLESGFEVGLELGEDGQLPDFKLHGKLPANPQLAARSRQHWDETYRDLGQTYRIKKPEVFYGGHINRRIEECKQSAKQLEADFNRWLKSPSFQRIREEWRGFVSRPEEVRVLVQTQDPWVEKLPWHEWDLLKRDYEKGEIGLGYWEYRRREGRSSGAREKVRVLAIFGSSEGIDLQTDRQLLAQLGDRAEIDIFIEPQRQQINDRLWEQHWDIIFFAGHSETQGNEGRLYLNANDSLTLGELWYGLRTAAKNGLQLAIFNSCDGLGLARSLDDILIPQVIVMRERVPDPVAQAFLRYFLRAFASGKSLYLSVREAREQLQGLEKDFPCATWLPVIYQSPAQVPLTWEEYLRSPVADLRASPRQFGTVQKTATIAALCGLGAIAYPAAIHPVGVYLNRLGAENIAAQRFDRARFYFELSLRLGANKPRVLNNLGYLYQRMREFDLAREKFHQSKLLGDPWGCNNEAFLDILEGDYQRADQLLRGCLGPMQQTQSELGEYLVRKNLGWALLMKPGTWKLGDYREAEEHLATAIAIEPEGGTANCLQAQVLEKLDRPEAALEEWQSCWQFVPDNVVPESDWKKMAQQRLEEAGEAGEAEEAGEAGEAEEAEEAGEAVGE